MNNDERPNRSYRSGRFRGIVDQTIQVGGKAARATGRAAVVTGKAVLWTAAGVAGLVLLLAAAGNETEEEDQKPPIIARFEGSEDTFTTPFTTTGPWQISWQGYLDIEVWRQEPDEPPAQYDRVTGNSASAFFPLSGTFYLVIRCIEPGFWTIFVRSR
jgi:hypothetical protein